MLRAFLAATALSTLLTPAFAEEMKCDEASMMKVQAGVDEARKNSSMKAQEDMAIKHLDMAKEAMVAKEVDECVMHLDEAIKALNDD